MKVQERTGAGNHRVPSPAQSSGERLPSVTRERKPALAALAVLLILVGALGATVLVLRAGNRVEVAKLAHDVPAGTTVTKNDLRSVMVANDNSIDYVKWDQVGGLARLRTKSTLYGGSLLVGQMFTGEKGTPAGKAVVGLSLKDGQYPADIKAGDTVTAYRVGDKVSGSSSGSSNDNAQTGGSGGGPIVERAVVTAAAAPASGTISSGNRSITVTVDAADAAALAEASANGEVALVLVPNNG
ncbi:hypothetical protein AB0436_24270 [Streptomyces sp. NPDC051322]|uniref:hypothetical protein n=1 Tax=Streptomyces sp. NPDC051322 TaxID=3154645 RepID=UPI00344EA153